MDQKSVDTNIEFFSRHIDKVRRFVALWCIFLIVLSTLPFVVTQFQDGWDVVGVAQSLVVLIFFGLFVRVYTHGYTVAAGIIIFVADVFLNAAGIFRPDAHFLIAMFFFTPPIIAYLFFSPYHALFASVTSYFTLNFIYFHIFFTPNDSSFVNALIFVAIAGFASIAGLHVLLNSRHGVERKLMQLAHSDALTGLPNRMHFESRIDQEIERCRREDSPLCLALVDLDYFKKVNDTYGHELGDKVLSHVARLLQTSLRAQDISCRYGGEEFVIIMPNTSLAKALPTLERARAGIENSPLECNGHKIAMTASFGCAELAREQMSYEDLFELGDKCLYNAKAHGRNQICSEE